MSRFLAIPLVLVSSVMAVPAGDLPVAPAPRAVKPRLALAPAPHVPGEVGLTLEDLGLDLTVPKFDVERIPDVTVPGTVSPNDPIGLPDLKIPAPLPPDRLLPPAGIGADQPGTNPEPKKQTGPFANRGPAARDLILKNSGGNDESEKAVALGLAWLAKQQKPDGSWEFDATAKQKKVAATGFAVLAFLGAGETHKAKDKGKYQKTVNAGVTYLVKQCATAGPNAGKISADAYEQGIATLALCEAYALTKDADIKVATQAAVNYVQKAQGPNGSWGYSAGSNGDTSITGWQVQALFTAKQSKELVVNDQVIKKAIKFLDSVAAGARKATYGYADSTGAQGGTALTASGLWSRYCIDGWGPNHPGMTEGATGLLKNPPNKDRLDLYYLHYATMVMKAYGGDEWITWNEGPKGDGNARSGGLRDVLISKQEKKEGANLGSWEADGGFLGGQCGRLGTTALCIINLESYYRYSPLPAKEAADPKEANPKK